MAKQWLWTGLAWLGCAFVAGAGEDASSVQKYESQDLPFRSEREILSPGLFDPELAHVLTFPSNGTPVDLGLPHEGLDKDGKLRAPVTGSFQQGFLWLDLDADGKKGAKEVFPAGPGTSSGPFVAQAYYDDSSSGPCAFKLLELGEPGKFKLVRCGAKRVKAGKNVLLLLDDDGNGKFNDIGRDALIVDNRPVNFLGRQIYLGATLYELLVHPAGQVIELKPLENVATGKLDLFLLHKIPQKSENLRIHTVIISGKDVSFSFDRASAVQEVPVGAYDMAFGLLERSGELVYFKRGERTSFAVEAGKAATPAWGAPVGGTVALESDGKEIKVAKPAFKGAAGEVYFPADYEKIPLRAYLKLIVREPRLGNIETFNVVGSKQFDSVPGGDIKGVAFKEPRSGEFMVSIEYKSGILGAVQIDERIAFVAKK